jgi:hypothetical protein
MCSNQILFKLIRKSIALSKDLIVETNISLENDVNVITNLFSGRNEALTEIYLSARKEILLDRVIKRWNSGSRHLGHADNERLHQIEKYIDDSMSQPIRLGHRVIELDSSEITPEELEEKIKLELKLN